MQIEKQYDPMGFERLQICRTIQKRLGQPHRGSDGREGAANLLFDICYGIQI